MCPCKIQQRSSGTSENNKNCHTITIGCVKSQLGLLKHELTFNAKLYSEKQLEGFLVRIKTLRRMAHIE